MHLNLNPRFLGRSHPVLCPQCGREGEDAASATIKTDSRFPDKAIKRLMGKQRVVCTNPGCQWKGFLNEYVAHEGECSVAPVECPHEGCGVEMPRYVSMLHVPMII